MRSSQIIALLAAERRNKDKHRIRVKTGRCAIFVGKKSVQDDLRGGVTRWWPRCRHAAKLVSQNRNFLFLINPFPVPPPPYPAFLFQSFPLPIKSGVKCDSASLLRQVTHCEVPFNVFKRTSQREQNSLCLDVCSLVVQKQHLHGCSTPVRAVCGCPQLGCPHTT